MKNFFFCVLLNAFGASAYLEKTLEEKKIFIDRTAFMRGLLLVSSLNLRCSGSNDRIASGTNKG